MIDVIIPGTSRARADYEALQELYFELKHDFDKSNIPPATPLTGVRFELKKLDRVITEMENCSMPPINPFQKIDYILNLLAASEYHLGDYKKYPQVIQEPLLSKGF